MEQSLNLVVLCGNAGDGKTALLQRLAKRLGLDVQTSATRILTGRSQNGLTVRMNLDGSASWQGRSADDLLDEFLAPFHDGRPKEAIVHLLAINDGRLLEWIENVEDRNGETPLTKVLYESLENRASNLQSHIHFVNLNQRSLVGGISADGKTIDTTFLDHLVDSLYGGELSSDIWAPCQTCSAQERCEVFRTARRFWSRWPLERPPSQSHTSEAFRGIASRSFTRRDPYHGPRVARCLDLPSSSAYITAATITQRAVALV